MLQLSLAGRLGRDAEYKQTQGGDELCRFSVATDVGFGDRKQTHWIDVTRWGKGAKGLSEHLRKGDSVAVTGELSTHVHDGKTYLQCRADRVTLLGGKDASKSPPTREEMRHEINNAGGGVDDLDDEIPY
jgi:single-strand DNA-binding protein